MSAPEVINARVPHAIDFLAAHDPVRQQAVSVERMELSRRASDRLDRLAWPGLRILVEGDPRHASQKGVRTEVRVLSKPDHLRCRHIRHFADRAERGGFCREFACRSTGFRDFKNEPSVYLVCEM